MKFSNLTQRKSILPNPFQIFQSSRKYNKFGVFETANYWALKKFKSFQKMQLISELSRNKKNADL